MSDAESFPPYTFADTTGKRWSLKLTFGKKNKIKREVGIDISAVVSDGMKPLLALANDPDKLGQAVFLLVEDQLANKQMTVDEFLEPFDGATARAAQLALVEAVADFFQNPRLADAFREMQRIEGEIGAKAVQMIAASIDVEQEAKKLIEPDSKPEES
jgi:hypothetical protein|tara:strand:+ start:11524 stop:11997 length:474 start_codon:yes stop_codon:yes gene_type:complete